MSARKGGKIRLVLPSKIGKGLISSVDSLYTVYLEFAHGLFQRS